MGKSLWGAGRVTVIALMILFGSSLFSNVLAASGSSAALIDWVAGFEVSPYVMLLMMFGILLLLGMFMDQLAMMLLTVPIFFPIVLGLEFGLAPEVKLIWFGVIMLLAMEISFTTPPFGLLLFVMQGVAPPGTRFGEICVAALPFMGCAPAADGADRDVSRPRGLAALARRVAQRTAHVRGGAAAPSKARPSLGPALDREESNAFAFPLSLVTSPASGFP